MKKVLLTLLLIYSALTIQESAAMQGAASRTATTTNNIYSYLSPTIIDSVPETLFWMIAVTRCLSSGISRIKVLINEKKALALENCTPVSQEVEHFVKNEVKKITPKTIDAVVINPAYSQNYSIGSLLRNILMAQYVADEIEKALKTNDLVIINKWKAVIQHEATHIANNDLFWYAMVEISLPYAIGGIIRYVSNQLPLPQKTFFQKMFFAIEGGLLAYSLTQMTKSIFCKHREQRADNNITDEIDLLNGFKILLDETESLNKSNYTQYSQKMYKLIRWLQNLEEEHPLYEIRVAKLDKRIALLEKQNQEQQN